MSEQGVTVYEQLIGKTFDKVYQNDDAIYFEQNGEVLYKLAHSQDCCEHVYIESIVGDLNDLTGQPLYIAEVVYQDASEEENSDGYLPDSATWSFFKFATIKGYVDVRFYGESNGYYSETAELFEKGSWSFNYV